MGNEEMTPTICHRVANSAMSPEPLLKLLKAKNWLVELAFK
jgi:hypothetical protein